MTVTSITLHNHGYPRIGAHRELKRAVESYWSNDLSRDDLRATSQRLRATHWQQQADTGLDLIPVGDFSLYDPFTELTLALGAIPRRFERAASLDPIDRLFYLARGRDPSAQSRETHALEMSKWFDTNYHILIPEIEPDTELRADASVYCEAIAAARAAGHGPKPVITGPFTWLSLAKSHSVARADGNDHGFTPFDRLADVIDAYAALLTAVARELAGNTAASSVWIQLDEPALAYDLDTPQREAARRAIGAVAQRVKAAIPAARILVAIPFGQPDFEALIGLPIDGWHIDLTRRDGATLEATLDWLAGAIVAQGKRTSALETLSLGLIDGRNVWANRLANSVDTLSGFTEQLTERTAQAGVAAPALWLAPSCSLALVPISTRFENQLAARHPILHGALAFADEKLAELAILRDALTSDGERNAAARTAIERNRDAWARLDALPERTNDSVRRHTQQLRDSDARRPAPYSERAAAQRAAFNLPRLPTTTIGSFPQTADIRALRRDFRSGKVDATAYKAGIRAEIDRVIAFQETAGLDVLVHGEPERNDMVEFFGELLDGYAFTQNGWVQSYGTRCVKPPILWADVARTRPLGTEWIVYAQGRTDRPVKGMLTGPVTLLKWAFPREDLEPADIALQLALALREEINALVDAGIRIIQVDEPAFREGLPLKRSQWTRYLDWAVRAFRIATAHEDPSVQIHTHMCYSEFNDIIEAIAALDADVITIETARSNMEILAAFERFNYPNEVGPGVYDIHSPRIPETHELTGLLDRAQRGIPAERLWVNPDCGLKTRAWPEVEASLTRMVDAARKMRAAKAAA
ncbi:MAG: 5-methyltetrahydropteroyltriglutamate--homocysteine S-methyltransferase [Thioalkalivibrionaceae bacterium]